MQSSVRIVCEMGKMMEERLLITHNIQVYQREASHEESCVKAVLEVKLLFFPERWHEKYKHGV